MHRLKRLAIRDHDRRFGRKTSLSDRIQIDLHQHLSGPDQIAILHFHIKRSTVQRDRIKPDMNEDLLAVFPLQTDGRLCREHHHHVAADRRNERPFFRRDDHAVTHRFGSKHRIRAFADRTDRSAQWRIHNIRLRVD